MLSTEDNDLLTKTGPNTPMGDLFRRFWLPAMLSEELPVPDSAPMKVTLLGEQLVAFKDSSGRIGILDSRCPHRSANLFWGRNEEDGIRCAYHGWKFDVNGRCVDLPNAPEGSEYKNKISARASYPAVENGGFIWVYMGPKEIQPTFPHFEINELPKSHSHITKVMLRANWLQLMEGELDSSHVSFLHSSIGDSQNALTNHERGQSTVFSSKAPKWAFKETDAGIMLGAFREGEGNQRYWRVNQWMMPAFTMIAAKPGTPVHLQIRVPIDDTSSIFYRVAWNPNQPLSERQRWDAEHGGVNFPELIPGTYTAKENMDNNYLIDRVTQKTASFTGIKSIPAQDWAVQEDMGGPIADRSIEHLVSSDAAIIAVRKRLINAARNLQEGTEPPEPHRHSNRTVRPLDIMLNKEEDIWETGAPYLEGSRWQASQV
jgi:phthalate 4,5-dioxygenase oxygenase subunit